MILLLSLFFGENATAKQSDEFINFLSQKIYNDCNNERFGLIIGDKTPLGLEDIMPQKMFLDCEKNNNCILDIRTFNNYIFL